MKNKDTWNLGLLYKSDNDPQIERDLQAIEKAFSAFEKKYKGKDFISSANKLKQALDDYKNLEKVANGHKPYTYFHYRQDTDSQNKAVESRMNQYYQRVVGASNRTSFFPLTVGKIDKKVQAKFLKDQKLREYKYLLEKIFLQAQYNLTDAEEQLASLLSQPGKKMWTDGQAKLLNQQTVKYKGKNLPISQAVAMISDLPKGERRKLHSAVNDVAQSVSHFAESEINALYTFKKIMDERRGFKKPYSSTLLYYENDEKTVENLVNLVTKNFHISRRFYKLHAKLLGEKKITAADRNVKIGNVKKKFDWETSIEIIKRAFKKVDPKYVEIFDQFVKNGQFDIYPRVGKRDGAYCSSGGDNPVFVLLNHADNLRSYETIAHEMGHAFHAEFCRKQPYHYRDVSMATAEVASTFFEQVALEELENVLDKKDYAVLLHNQIQGDVATVIAQIAYFNCELELHERVRKEGFVSKEEMAKTMAKHLRSYLGDAVEVSDKDGYFFVRIPHLRYFFYLYTYSYGQLISKAMFEKWKEDPSYIKKVEEFLSAGSSKSPRDIFKSIGIDTADPKFFEAGLKSIERDIEKLEKLTR